MSETSFIIGVPVPVGLDAETYRVRVVVDRLDEAPLGDEDIFRIEAVYAVPELKKRRAVVRRIRAERELQSALAECERAAEEEHDALLAKLDAEARATGNLDEVLRWKCEHFEERGCGEASSCSKPATKHRGHEHYYTCDADAGPGAEDLPWADLVRAVRS